MKIKDMSAPPGIFFPIFHFRTLSPTRIKSGHPMSTFDESSMAKTRFKRVFAIA